MFFNCISSDRKTLLALQIHMKQILFNEKAKIWRKTRKIFTIRDFDSTYHLSFVIHVQNIVGVSNLAAQLWNKLFICYKTMGFKSRQSPGKQQAEFDNCTESSLEKYCSNWKLFFGISVENILLTWVSPASYLENLVQFH